MKVLNRPIIEVDVEQRKLMLEWKDVDKALLKDPRRNPFKGFYKDMVEIHNKKVKEEHRKFFWECVKLPTFGTAYKGYVNSAINDRADIEQVIRQRQVTLQQAIMVANCNNKVYLDMDRFRQAGMSDIKLSNLKAIFVYEWGRDCDCCESDSMSIIPATISAFQKLEADVYDNAEGPCAVSVVTKSDAESFENQFRDRVMEAYENGNTYNV